MTTPQTTITISKNTIARLSGLASTAIDAVIASGNEYGEGMLETLEQIQSEIAKEQRESLAQFMLSALLVAEATLSAYGEQTPALAVIREAIARATIEERL
jgi:hypothetical protein